MLLYLVLVLFLLYLVVWYRDRQRVYRMLKDYGYKVPPINIICGNLHQLAINDLKAQEKWFELYGEEVGKKGGRILGWYRGPNPAIWTTCPEILKEIFIKDSETFIDRPMLDRSDNIPHLLNMKVIN